MEQEKLIAALYELQEKGELKSGPKDEFILIAPAKEGEKEGLAILINCRAETLKHGIDGLIECFMENTPQGQLMKSVMDKIKL